jgi:hypothetical protein
MDNLVFGLILIAIIISVIIWLFNNAIFRQKLRLYTLRLLELDDNIDYNKKHNLKKKYINRKNKKINQDVQIIEDTNINSDVNSDVNSGVNSQEELINEEEFKQKTNADILDNISIDSISIGSLNSNVSDRSNDSDI